MRRAFLLISIALSVSGATTQVGTGPMASPLAPAIPDPHDRVFRGTIQLSVNATDTAHGIFHTTEIVPVQSSGDMVLLYPEWETTSHAPTASAIELAGLHIEAEGRDLPWRRDPVDIHAFHVTAPSGAQTLTLNFECLSPQSSAELRPELIDVQWQRLLLYPAGWYTRDISVAPRLQLPSGLHAFTALTLIAPHIRAPQSIAEPVDSASVLAFAPETLDRVVDAPVYAARYTQQFDLSSSTQSLVHLDLLADAPSSLAITPSLLAHLRELVKQTRKVFGPPPFAHYDALVSLSDELSPGGGLEHLEEGENNLPANYLTAGGQQLNNQDLIAHEYVHAWNGRYRQPAGLWSPNFNRPTDPSLLWVYEGQTEFWGRVLAARSGLRTMQETLDKLALDAALVSDRPGREWKNLADSTLDAIYMPGHIVAWRDWQRREDYYPEGVLLWLDVDARLRKLSHDKIGLDDFASRFFGTHGRTEATSTYTFEDVCEALNLLASSDWKEFLDQHLLSHSNAIAMAGLEHAGWRVIFTSTPTETFSQAEIEAGVVNLDNSIGAQLRPNGTVRSVVWNGPAFRAGLAPGAEVTAINGQPFTTTLLLSAVANSAAVAIRLTLRAGHREVSVPYAGPLRYPRLERIPGKADRLTRLLQPR